MARKPTPAPGMTYGTIKLLEPAATGRRGQKRWLCSCSCGNPMAKLDEETIRLVRYPTCGECVKWIRHRPNADPQSQAKPKTRTRTRTRITMDTLRVDTQLIARFPVKPGQIFGCLQAIGPGPTKPDGTRTTRCSCNCGTEAVDIPTVRLINKKALSCGCLNRKA